MANSNFASLIRFPTEIIRNIFDYITHDAEFKCIVIIRGGQADIRNGPVTHERFLGHECPKDSLLTEVVAETTYLEYPLQRFVRNGGDTADYAALANVCRTLHVEALDYLYGGLPLHFLSLEDMELFFRSLAPQHRARVRSVRLSVPLWPEVPQERIHPRAGGAPDIHVAMDYLRAILGEVPGITKVHVLTHLPRLLEDEELEDFDTLSDFEDYDLNEPGPYKTANEHAQAVAQLQKTIREADGRDVAMSHSIAAPFGLDEGFEIISPSELLD